MWRSPHRRSRRPHSTLIRRRFVLMSMSVYGALVNWLPMFFDTANWGRQRTFVLDGR
jgi:hypothetical protein